MKSSLLSSIPIALRQAFCLLKTAERMSPQQLTGLMPPTILPEPGHRVEVVHTPPAIPIGPNYSVPVLIGAMWHLISRHPPTLTIDAISGFGMILIAVLCDSTKACPDSTVEAASHPDESILLARTVFVILGVFLWLAVYMSAFPEAAVPSRRTGTCPSNARTQ